jgi:hypothetical protein
MSDFIFINQSNGHIFYPLVEKKESEIAKWSEKNGILSVEFHDLKKLEEPNRFRRFRPPSFLRECILSPIGLYDHLPLYLCDIGCPIKIEVYKYTYKTDLKKSDQIMAQKKAYDVAFSFE